MLEEEDIGLYAVVKGGNKLVDGEQCIINFFSKKPRSRAAAAIPTYDFSTVLEIMLRLSGNFCENVDQHRLIKENSLQVCWLDAMFQCS